MSKKSTTSKEKILLTACRLFAEKGFRDTTIRDICREAETYQISINYYFQSKQNLFEEALLKAYELSFIEDVNKLSATLEPKEVIELSIRNKINSFFDNSEKSWFFKILSSLFLEQQDMSEETYEQTLGKHEKIISDSLRSLAPSNTCNDDIEYGYFLILSQLFTLTFHPVVNEEFLKCCKPNSKETEWLIAKIKKTVFDSLNIQECKI